MGIPGHTYGANLAVKQYGAHLQKGCLCDPLPCCEMSYQGSKRVSQRIEAHCG
jgi:hypothetical protein